MVNFPSPKDLFQKFPLSRDMEIFIKDSRRRIQEALQSVHKQRLLIIGPCSVHDVESTLSFAEKYHKIQEKVAPFFFCLMRVYVEKPRTSLGWPGFLWDPKLDWSGDLLEGLERVFFLMRSISSLGCPIASEFLSPGFVPYLQRFVSWGCVGARTGGSPLHRILASALPMPVGIKNSIYAPLEESIQSLRVAQSPHTFLLNNDLGGVSPVCSQGNQDVHLILRGSVEGENYQKVEEATGLLHSAQICTRVLVDCAHDNSAKSIEGQKKAFSWFVKKGHTLPSLGGVMLEAHLHEGSQKVEREAGCPLRFGVSVTDPCLSFVQVEALVDSLLEQVYSLR